MGIIKTEGLIELEEFLKSELIDYDNIQYKINITEDNIDEVYFEVEFKRGIRESKHYPLSIYFKYDKVSRLLYVDTSEEIYEEVDFYSWRVKYFWIMFDWNKL